MHRLLSSNEFPNPKTVLQSCQLDTWLNLGTIPVGRSCLHDIVNTKIMWLISSVAVSRRLPRPLLSSIDTRLMAQQLRGGLLRRRQDALCLLRRDHERAQSFYEGFQTAGGDDRYFLASRILRLLEQH